MPPRALTSEPGLEPLEDQRLLTHRVETRLREAILTGRFAPGDRLSVPELARMLGVSRTPAREALFSLERDGLVEVNPRRGAVVLRGTARDLYELLELREAYEGTAARLAAERADASVHQELDQLLTQHRDALLAEDTDTYLAVDLAFHGLLVEAAGNTRLERAFAQLRDQIRVVMRAGAQRPEPLGRSVIDDHRAIARAVQAADPAGAEHAARAHVARIRAFVVPLLFPTPPTA